MRSADILLTPFWEGNIAYDESVLFLSENGQTPNANLLYPPTEILGVCSSDFEIQYQEGIDWELKDGKLYLPAGSAIASMDAGALHFYSDETQDCFDAKDGGKILYKTKGFFHKQQVLVTYRHEAGWVPAQSMPGSHALENVKNKITETKHINLCFYGDSITAGCDGSKPLGFAPFQDSWPRLVTESFEKTYGCEVTYVNTAVGGKQSDWGLENVEERLTAYDPDLVVLAFGMNDGTEKVDPEAFRHNIMGIKSSVLARNPKAEFILISTTVANPESVFDGRQREYLPILTECMGQGDILVNMTEVHDRLLTRKRFVDMTGNNINHPNDYLIRVYAQMILEGIKKAMQGG